MTNTIRLYTTNALAAPCLSFPFFPHHSLIYLEIRGKARKQAYTGAYPNLKLISITNLNYLLGD